MSAPSIVTWRGFFYFPYVLAKKTKKISVSHEKALSLQPKMSLINKKFNRNILLSND